MNKTVLCAALASLATLAANAAFAADAMTATPKEKCYGIAKAGKNDCKSASGAHGCAGQASQDNNASEFKLVGAGSCVKDGGSLTPPAK